MALETAGADRFVPTPVANRADVMVSLGRADEAVAVIEGILPRLAGADDPHQVHGGNAVLGRAQMRAGDLDAARGDRHDRIPPVGDARQQRWVGVVSEPDQVVVALL